MDAYENGTLIWYQSLEISPVVINLVLQIFKCFRIKINSFFTKWIKLIEVLHLISWVKFYLLWVQRLSVKHHVYIFTSCFDSLFCCLMLCYWKHSSSRSYTVNTSDYKIFSHKCNRLFNELFFTKLKKKSEDPDLRLHINEI